MGTSHQRLYTQPLGNVYVFPSLVHTLLKAKDTLQIDFMALTMIDPTSSWFKIAEYPVVERLRQQTVNGKELLIADDIFDKTSERKAKLI